jgi:hypothetical protein
MKSLMTLYHQLLNEMGSWCHTSTTLDWKTIKSRVKEEGLPFLTITLPRFGKDLLVGLDQGRVDRHLFVGFQRKGELPRFLGGFLDRIFDRSTGVLLDSVDIDSIRSVLQLTLIAEKIELDTSRKRQAKAFRDFVKCEQDVRQFESTVSPEELRAFGRVSDLLWRELFTKVDENIYRGEIIPRHGPGATADKLKGNQKFVQTEWPARLERIFPSREMLISNDVSFFKELDRVNILEPGAERPVRVITVPKTQKTPRIIAIEPTAMQYVQQGILERFVEGIESSDTLRNLIGFMDQSPNQILAHEGSLTGDLATLDLSEASDRVSCLLVAVMLRNHKHLAMGVAATRSTKADVPGHGVLTLSKFASMGSALCFPMESMVFMTCVFLGISRELNKPVTKKMIKSFLGSVRTYGDDIIVPVRFVDSVVATLTDYGFKVNANKSFWTGKFRESCGKWYYAGEEVTPIRLRQLLPSHRRNVPEVVSTVSFRNQAYKSGLWQTVRYLDNLLEKVIPFPAVEETSSGLGKVSFIGHQTDKWDFHLQAPLVRAMVVKVELPDNSLDGPPALLKFFLKRGEHPFADRKHLGRSGRPSTVDIKARFVRPF